MSNFCQVEPSHRKVHENRREKLLVGENFIKKLVFGWPVNLRSNRLFNCFKILLKDNYHLWKTKQVLKGGNKIISFLAYFVLEKSFKKVHTGAVGCG
jgi:hypothetical protein